MKSKVLLCIGAASVLAVSCTNDSVVDVNPDPVGNALTFSPSVGARSIETTISNLGSIGVFAHGLDHNYGLYNNYVIGKEDAGSAIPEIAHREGAVQTSQGIWKLSRNVYWPTGVSNILFWGVSTLRQPEKNGDGSAPSLPTEVMGNNGTFKFVNLSEHGLQILGFTPKREETRTASYGDGLLQQDLVVANTAQMGNTTNNIPLQFGHALAQVQIKATAGVGQPAGTRRVLVKGAWIVNARSQAIYSSTFTTKDGTDGGKLITFKQQWSTHSEPVAYGALFENAILLTENPTSIINNRQGTIESETGSLMLIPQNVNKWNANSDKDEYDACTTTDAYILLYCRVELVHEGDVHEGDANIGSGDGKHYHQLFPVADTYKADSYGYTCVPVKIDWEAGKCYTYTLNICGASSGAGVYPPVIPTDVPKIDTVIPDGKKPGDAVLDDPISFTVTVAPWPDDQGWIEGETGNM